MYHMDAYQIGNASEAEDMDIDTMLENGVLVVEWAERIEAVLPKACLWVKMRYIADEQRGMVFTVRGPRSEQLLSQFRRRVFGG